MLKAKAAVPFRVSRPSCFRAAVVRDGLSLQACPGRADAPTLALKPASGPAPAHGKDFGKDPQEIHPEHCEKGRPAHGQGPGSQDQD